MTRTLQRGQNLVLFAMSLLLLTAMVLVTLQVGMRTREKVESQMVADAAAYSQAVTTARTYNMVAVLNRARAAHYVAILGTESLVSWSGMVRGSAASVAAALASCGATAQAAALMTSAAHDDPAWEMADDDAGQQARDHQGEAGGLSHAAESLYVDRLMGTQLKDQQLASRIARHANPELMAPAGGDAKSMAEVDITCTTGAACLHSQSHAFRSVVMGSRGWVFTTDRAQATNVAGTLSLAAVVNTAGGGSGFGDDPWYGDPKSGVPAERSQVFATMAGEAAWAEDHGGVVTIQVGGCTASATVSSAFVMSSASEILDDRHAYSGTDSKHPEAVRHTLLPCPLTTPGCPQVIGGSVAFNHSMLGDPGNDFGQPKLYSIITRDYRGRTFTDPWNLLFHFQFSRVGPGAMFDNGNPRGSFRTPAGADLSHQVSLGAGLVYYHRPVVPGGGGYREPPNFWNPFWRATLAPPDRDAGDRLFAAGFPETKSVIDLLISRGYRGVP